MANNNALLILFTGILFVSSLDQCVNANIRQTNHPTYVLLLGSLVHVLGS